MTPRAVTYSVQNPEAQGEAIVMKFGKRLGCSPSRHGVTRINVGDSRCNTHGVGRRKQPARGHKRLAAKQFRHPYRIYADLLCSSSNCRDLCSG